MAYKDNITGRVGIKSYIQIKNDNIKITFKKRIHIINRKIRSIAKDNNGFHYLLKEDINDNERKIKVYEQIVNLTIKEYKQIEKRFKSRFLFDKIDVNNNIINEIHTNDYCSLRRYCEHIINKLEERLIKYETKIK